MKLKHPLSSIFWLTILAAPPVHAKPVTVPLQLDYGLIRKILVSELYQGADNTAKVWEDGHDCGFLTLADPQLSGEKGLVRMLNKMQTRIGARLGGQCIPLLNFSGTLETLQQPTLDARNAVITLPIVDMKAYDTAGNPFGNGKLWKTVRRYVEPKLSKIKLDLHEAKDKIRKTLPELVPEENAAQVRQAIESLAFNAVSADAKGVNLAFDLDMPDLKNAGAKLQQESGTPLSEQEIRQWRDSWKHWESFLADAIQQATADTQKPALRDDLQAILADARGAFEKGLSAQPQSGEDPVRSFFTRSWPRLAPALKDIANDLPGAQSLRYLTFIAATDVLYELDNRGALLGLEISSEGLRKLARLLMAENAKS